ncbi:hypothetical protein MHYP_G00308570 [Metynnis hypsauchen]
MASPYGPFSECHSSLHPRARVADCTSFLEHSGGAKEALCEALQGYAVLCQQNGIVVREWRNITNCGFVRCFPSSCSEQETCRIVGGEYGCHPLPRATCSASGDPHYTSFDEQTFDFQGTCKYILATTDGETRNLPVLLDSGRISIYCSGQNTFITIDFGLSVSYDGPWVVCITVPSNYSGTTCCLCDNFNGQRGDNFRKRSGAVASSAFEFGSDWKVENDTLCSDGCGDSCSSCQNPVEAQAQCQILRDSQGPLSFCHATVNPHADFDDCLFDLCLSGYRHAVLCRSIQTYIGEQFWTPGCSQCCECFAPNDLRCYSASCSLTQECVVRKGLLGCYSRMSSYMVWGDPHYLTFDGAVINFQVVGTDMDSSAFQIGSLAEVHQEQDFVVVNASNELMVYFDGRFTLSIKLGPSFQGSVCGMCGNNNGDPADDKAQ